MQEKAIIDLAHYNISAGSRKDGVGLVTSCQSQVVQSRGFAEGVEVYVSPNPYVCDFCPLSEYCTKSLEE